VKTANSRRKLTSRRAKSTLSETEFNKRYNEEYLGVADVKFIRGLEGEYLLIIDEVERGRGNNLDILYAAMASFLDIKKKELS
jgi:hypothetical protein